MPLGRPPKPSAVKRREGNPGGRRLHDDVQAPATIPDCPDHLDGEARAEWVRVTSELDQMNLLSGADRGALSAYCQTWSRWVEAEKKIQQNGLTTKTRTGWEVQSPWVGVANKALSQMHRFLTEFGLSPVSRARLAGAPKKEKQDDLAALLAAPRPHRSEKGPIQ